MSDLELIEAVKAGDYAQAQALIQNDADVNQSDEQGWTPLNFAAGKGDLSLVKLLVESGADIFKVGRDRRTPYRIALAAGRVEVVKYLQEEQGKRPEQEPASAPRQYCKAYHLDELKKYPAWSEGQANWQDKANHNANGDGAAAEFTDDKVVFIHQDFTVTESIWHQEGVIFSQVTPEWQEFCTNSLNFKAPDDLDLIVPSSNNI